MLAIQSTGISEYQTSKLFDGAALSGVDYFDFGILPTTKEIVFDSSFSGVVLPFGSVSLIKIPVPQNWKIFHNDNFKVITFAPIIGNNFINPIYYIRKAKELINASFNDAVFMKPAGDTKEFDGTIIASGNTLGQFLSLKKHEYFDLEAVDVLVSKVKNPIAEYRFWVVNGDVVEFSFYNGVEISFNYSEALRLATLYQPDDAYVVDLSVFADHSLKIVEYNCINCSGFTFSSKPEKVFTALYNTYGKI